MINASTGRFRLRRVFSNRIHKCHESSDSIILAAQLDAQQRKLTDVVLCCVCCCFNYFLYNFVVPRSDFANSLQIYIGTNDCIVSLLQPSRPTAINSINYWKCESREREREMSKRCSYLSIYSEGCQLIFYVQICVSYATYIKYLFNNLLFAV